MTVDLRKCVPGQKLVSKHGMILEYCYALSEEDYYNHVVRYPNGSCGTRIHDGHVCRNQDRRLETDHDIIEVLPVMIQETITEWFNPRNENHLKEYRHLQQTGSWREGVIPEELKFSNLWHIELANKIANVYIQMVLSGEIEL